MALCACGAPGIDLRYDYVGQRLLEPNLTPRPVQRDALGNPIFEPHPALRNWPTYATPGTTLAPAPAQ
jgi:hypothetical protein